MQTSDIWTTRLRAKGIYLSFFITLSFSAYEEKAGVVKMQWQRRSYYTVLVHGVSFAHYMNYILS